MTRTRKINKERKAARKQLWSTINLLAPAALIQQLDTQGLSIIGESSVLKERLYRFSIISVEPDATSVEWDPSVDERPNDVLPATTAGMNLQVSRLEEPFSLPPLQESPIVQNGTPCGRGARGMERIAESIEEAASAPTYVQRTIPTVRSTPVVKSSEKSSQSVHARLLQQSTAFAERVLAVTNNSVNTGLPSTVPTTTRVNNELENGKPSNKDAQNQNAAAAVSRDSTPHVLSYSRKSTEDRRDREIKRLHREIRRLQVQERSRGSPSSGSSSTSSSHSNCSGRRHLTPPRRLPRRRERSREALRRNIPRQRHQSRSVSPHTAERNRRSSTSTYYSRSSESDEHCHRRRPHSRERKRSRSRGHDRYNRRRRRSRRRDSMASLDNSKDTLKMMKILKESNLSFSGESKDQPEEFLADLRDTVSEGHLDTKQVLRSLRVIFKDKALLWYKSERRNNSIRTWHDFKKSFRMRFIRQCDDEDTLDELKGRSQGKGETIAEYISCCRFIASHFRTPISEKRLVSILRKRLLPEYQIYLRKEKLTRVSELMELGKEYEEEQHRIRQYTAPKSKESMHYPEAGYISTEKKSLEKRVDAIASITTTAPNKNKRRNNNKNKTTQAESVDAVAQVANSPVAKPANDQPTRVLHPQIMAPTNLTGAVLKTLSTGIQAEPPSFSGQCSMCEQSGHRAKDCPKRGERLVCYNCGKLDVTSQNCPNEYCIRRRERWGNGLVEKNLDSIQFGQ